MLAEAHRNLVHGLKHLLDNAKSSELHLTYM